MDLYNNGYLKFSKPIGDDEFAIIDNYFRPYGNECVTKSEDDDCIVEFWDITGSINEMIDEMIDTFNVLGIEIEGRYEYNGDYLGGCIIKKGERVVDYNYDEYVIRTATLKKLVDELKKRGYVVIKEG